MTSGGGSCGACLRIARRRGLKPGSRLKLRSGHVGTVGLVNHCPEAGVMVLVYSSDERETVLLPLAAATGRECADSPRMVPAA